MLVKDARKILSPPLQFGNDLQIKARKFLEHVEFAKDRLRECSSGHADRAQLTMGGSRWEKERALALCECVEDFYEDERMEAARIFLNEVLE